MSILQEYESIRNRMKKGEFEAIEKYLHTHPSILLSDLYYNEQRYGEFYKWWKKQEDTPTETAGIVINTDDHTENIKLHKEIIDLSQNIQVYVDGSYNKDNDLTGAGIVIVHNDHSYTKSFTVPTEENHSWNINGECHATLEAIKICTGQSPIGEINFKFKNITINYDYMGIEKWITGEWKVKSKIAKVYLKEFRKLAQENDIKIYFNKIKAHTGDKFNEIADALAKEATI